MAKFVLGGKVRVRTNSHSPYRGCTGIVIQIFDHDFVVVYQVKMESYPSHLAQSGRFLEGDLESS